MQNKKGQLEFAIIKGLVMALIVLGGFYVYEKISGSTNNGQTITCQWDCQNVKWSECVGNYQYRDVTLCVPNEIKCWDSTAKPSAKRVC